ncbi:MAG: carbohydrate ABC transporter permease [Thermomicrobiales bacterium]|nr:carbohydrate ABC transporter permease [Thermomicrobiales bacterium]
MDVLARGGPIERVVRRAIIVLMLAGFVLPIALIVVTAFKTRVDALEGSPFALARPTLENYGHLFGEYDFGHFARNSFIASVASTAIALALGALAAYGLARFRFRGSGALAFWVLSLRMTPAIATIIPLFVMLRAARLIDSLPGLVIVYTVANLPLVVWMMKGFFEDLPIDMEESALIDGNSRFGAFLDIALPLAAPGLSATAILTFIFTWNEFLFALILTGRNAQTLPVAVTLFVRETGIDWGYMTAAASLMMLPMVIATLFVRRGLARGLTMGAVK